MPLPPLTSSKVPLFAGRRAMPKEGRRPGSEDKRVKGHRGVALRKRRLARTKGLCEDCLALTPPRTRLADVVDHIKPLGLGGLDADSNTRNLCHDHHAVRTAEQFGRSKPILRDAEGWPL